MPYKEQVNTCISETYFVLDSIGSHAREQGVNPTVQNANNQASTDHYVY